jgi:hypothetical protein
MTADRMSEHAPPPAGGEVPTPSAYRVQFLTTEHWSLLATRSLSWNESFSRTGMFLTLLTGAVVALALVAQATDFGPGFMLFALLTLPVVLFVGIATFVRLVEVNIEDTVWTLGMNRLRRAYLEMDPGLEPWLITGWTEDAAGLLRTYGAARSEIGIGQGILHSFVTTPAIVGFVNAMVAAILGGLLLLQFGASMEGAAVGGVVIFALAIVVAWIFSFRAAAHLFLPPPGEPGADDPQTGRQG